MYNRYKQTLKAYSKISFRSERILIMQKYRKDTKGQILHKGETYIKNRKQYRYTYTDVFGKRHSVYALSLDKLREKEKVIARDNLDGIDTYTRNKAEVNLIFDRYIANKTELKNRTLTDYRYIYDRFVRDGFGKRKIADVKYSDVIYFYNSLIKLDLSLSTINSIHSILSPTFQSAVRDEMIRYNPTTGAMAEIRKKDNREKSERNALTKKEQEIFFRCLNEPKSEKYKNLFTVLFGTGCRIGELIGLRWDDIDFEKRMISINHTLSYAPNYKSNYKSEFHITTPKTKTSNRTIPMLDKVYDALLSEKQKGVKCDIQVDGYTNFVFINSKGGLYTKSTLHTTLKRIVTNYNKTETVNAEKENRTPLLLPYFSPHIARHTFCTRLCENETNIKAIQTVMGHSNITTTLNIYAEVSENKQKEIFEKLNTCDII